METEKRQLTEEIILSELEASKPRNVKLAIHIILIVLYLSFALILGIISIFFGALATFVGILIGLAIIEIIRIRNDSIHKKGEYEVLLEYVTDTESFLNKRYLTFNFNRSKNFNRIKVDEETYKNTKKGDYYYVVLIKNYLPLLKIKYGIVFSAQDWEYKNID